MYQNQESVIATGASTQLREITNNVDTSAKIAEGDTVNVIGQTTIAGTPVKGGVEGTFVLQGHTYNVAISKQGKPTLTGYLADGYGHISMKGSKAVNPRGQYLSNDGKYDKTYSRTADEIYFDLPSGTLSINTALQNRDYTCGKYGCSPKNDWHTTNIVRIGKEQLGIEDLLNNKDISTRYIKSSGKTYTPNDKVAVNEVEYNLNTNNSGKYDTSPSLF
jgi:hypothetical protein